MRWTLARLLAATALLAGAAIACTSSKAPSPPSPTAPPGTATATTNLPRLYVYHRDDMATYSQFLLDQATAAFPEREGVGVALANSTDFYRGTPEKYAGSLFHMSEEEALLMRVGQTLSGQPPMSPPPVALTAAFPAACVTFLTRDPAVRTVRDLAGKRVFLGEPATVWHEKGAAALRAAGVWDSVELAPSLADGLELLFLGEVGAVVNGILFQRVTVPAVALLAITTRDVYGVSIPTDAIAAAAHVHPDWARVGLLEPQFLPAGTTRDYVRADYDLFRDDATCWGGGSEVYMASPDFDDEMAYAIVQGVLDNRLDALAILPFRDPLWLERSGHAWIPQSTFHPGARRAYDEAGLTYGVEGIRQWEANR